MTPEAIRYENSRKLALRIARRTRYTIADMETVRRKYCSEYKHKQVLTAIYYRLNAHMCPDT